LCHYAITGWAMNPDGSMQPGAAAVTFREHPALGARLFYAKLMRGYDHDPSRFNPLTRSQWSRVAHRLSMKDAQQRLIVQTGPRQDDLGIKEPEGRKNFERVIAELRAQGQIP
jgi:hypothetical protein